jgi:hypothetical protein
VSSPVVVWLLAIAAFGCSSESETASGNSTGASGAEGGAGGLSNSSSQEGSANSSGGASGDGSGGSASTASTTSAGGTAPIELPAPTCEAEGGNADVSEPELVATLFDRWHEAWLGSPVVADINADGEREILVPRGNLVLGWHLDGAQVFYAETAGGRIWASPIVADLVPSAPGLEVAVAARGEVYVWDSEANLIPGFPTEWQDELRTIAAGDIDADGEWELVAATTNKLSGNDRLDILIAYGVSLRTPAIFRGAMTPATRRARSIRTWRSATWTEMEAWTLSRLKTTPTSLCIVAMAPPSTRTRCSSILPKSTASASCTT